MEKMNKEYFNNFRNDVREALKAVAEKYDVEINPANIKYDDKKYGYSITSVKEALNR